MEEEEGERKAARSNRGQQGVESEEGGTGGGREGGRRQDGKMKGNNCKPIGKTINVHVILGILPNILKSHY